MVDSLGHRQSNPATARLLDRDGLPIGAGFVVGPRTIATCAHVVAAITDTDPESAAAPESPITLDFPLATDFSEKTARVTGWQPIRPDGSGDIALLELDEPADIPIPPLWRIDAPWGRRFRVLGFPDGQPDGVWSCGEFRAPQGTGWIQMHGSAAETRIEAGFSGSPVWDDASGAIIGMTVAADARPGSSTGFLIPIDRVLGVDPRLLPNPYRGLESFGEADSGLFFGRDEETERLVTASGRSRLVAVTGHSGAGKSSLVRAGLLPVLRAEGVRYVVVDAEPAGNRPSGAGSVVLRGSDLVVYRVDGAAAAPRDEIAIAPVAAGWIITGTAVFWSFLGARTRLSVQLLGSITSRRRRTP